jgi:uncharacterized membrane protein
MEFGKRHSIPDGRPPPVILETCVPCCGTGRIRERGNRIICKTCTGTGKTAVKAESTA